MDELEIENRLTKLEESTKSAHHRIDEMAKTQTEIHQLALAVNSLAGSVEVLCTDMTDVTGRVKCIEDKPAKRWDHLVDIIITAAAGTLFGYLISRMLK